MIGAIANAFEANLPSRVLGEPTNRDRFSLLRKIVFQRLIFTGSEQYAELICVRPSRLTIVGPCELPSKQTRIGEVEEIKKIYKTM